MSTRISLDENDFKSLMAGEVIAKGEVKICLQDIGYDKMVDLFMQVIWKEKKQEE